MSSHSSNSGLCVQVCILGQKQSPLLRCTQSVHNPLHKCDSLCQFLCSGIKYVTLQEETGTFVVYISYTQWLLLLLIESECLVKVCSSLIHLTPSSLCHTQREHCVGLSDQVITLIEAR